MKRIVIIIVIWIVLGCLFAELILNNNLFKGKEYLVYAFQIGAFTEEEKAQELAKTLPSSIILKTLNTSNKFYEELDTLESILAKTTDEAVYNKVNQGILDRYIESINL